MSGGQRFSHRSEIGHQKSPIRPEKFRTRLGLLDGIASVDGEIEKEGERDKAIWTKATRIKRASIKPQQPDYSAVYPAMRE
jgi:hypothetical protein